MKKINIIQKVLLSVLFAIGLNITSYSSDNPNIIVILIDDMGYMDSETYGSKYYKTPNLTRLANEGMLFANGYAASPLCSPTRASIMSGQHPARIRMTQAITDPDVAEPIATQPNASWNCGDVQNRHHLPLDIYTLGEALQDSGYHTAHIGKWHLYQSSLGEEYRAENRGFDFVIGGNHAPGPPDYYSPYKNSIPNLSPGPEGEYLNERLAQEAINWISTVKDSENPFFLNFWHYAVHGPVIPKLDLLQKYIDSRDPDAAQRCPEMATMLESMDTSIGILLDWLDEPGNAELKANTVIILTSDNGGNTHSTTENGDFWTSNRPLRGGKGNTYEGGVKVPWIVRWNDTVSAGSVCHTAVQTTDIYPTVLDIAGIPPKPGHILDGRSILPLFKGETMDEVPIFTDFPHRFGALCAPSAAVRLGDWKLIRFYWAGERAKTHYYELFNLARDSMEAINLREYYPDKVLELDALIEQHLLDVDALVPIANPNYTGPSPFDRGNYVPNMELSQQMINFKESGQDTIQLMNESGEKQRSFGLVIEGESWISVENTEDGKVIVYWDAEKRNGPGKVLFGWTGGATAREINGWTMEPLALEALFKDEEDLTIETLGSGSVIPSDGIHSYSMGEIVELTANPNDGFGFVNWVINGEEFKQNPIQLTMDRSWSAYALFSDGNIARIAKASARAYNIDAFPSKANDGDITAWSGWVDKVETSGMSSWLEFTWKNPLLFNRVVVYANPNQTYNINDYSIQYWDGNMYHDIIQIENNTDTVRTSTFPSVNAAQLRLFCTDEGDQARFYRIDEVEVYYDTKEITMEPLSGNGTVLPEAGIHYFARYDSIPLSATAATNWEFSKWVIDGTDIADNPLIVYVNAISSATAYFMKLIDLSALQNALITARVMVDTATVGNGAGEYSQEVVDLANNVILVAQNVLDTATLQSVIDAALVTLLAEMAKFVSNTTGFDHAVFSGFTVYPNPVEDALYFHTIDPLRYRITDFSGRVLMRGELQDNRVEVGILENGMYFLQIIRKNNTLESMTFLKRKN